MLGMRSGIDDGVCPFDPVRPTSSWADVAEIGIDAYAAVSLLSTNTAGREGSDRDIVGHSQGWGLTKGPVGLSLGHEGRRTVIFNRRFRR